MNYKVILYPLVSIKDVFPFILFWHHVTFTCSLGYRKILKGYVKSQYLLEASMIKRYIVKESIELCFEYMRKANLIGMPPRSCRNMCFISKCFWGVNMITKSCEKVLQAHLYILNNTNKVILHLITHKTIMKDNNPR